MRRMGPMGRMAAALVVMAAVAAMIAGRGASVSGYLVGADGRPLTNSVIVFTPKQTPLLYGETTIVSSKAATQRISNGFFTVPVMGGNYRVTIDNGDPFLISVPSDEQGYALSALISTGLNSVVIAPPDITPWTATIARTNVWGGAIVVTPSMNARGALFQNGDGLLVWTNTLPRVTQFGTVTEMLASSFDRGRTNFWCAGRTAANDGGGGLFYFSEGDTMATNLGTVFAAPAFTGRIIRVHDGVFNVRWFGATGGGTVDDTAAFADSITSFPLNGYDVHAGQLRIPPGNYKVTSPIRLPSGMEIIGAGSQNSIITSSITDTNVFEVVPADPSQMQHHVTIEGLSIFSPGNCTAGSVLWLDASAGFNFNMHALISDVYISGGYRGITLNDTTFSTLQRVEIVGADLDGFNLMWSQNALHMENCQAYGCGRHGLYLESGNYCTFSDCEMESNVHDGWHFGTGEAGRFIANSQLVNCGAEDNGDNQFYFSIPRGISIDGFYATGGTNALMFEGGNGITITGGTAGGCPGYGVYLTTGVGGAAPVGFHVSGNYYVGGTAGYFNNKSPIIFEYSNDHRMEWGDFLDLRWFEKVLGLNGGTIGLTNASIMGTNASIDLKGSTASMIINENLIAKSWGSGYSVITLNGSTAEADVNIWSGGTNGDGGLRLNRPHGNGLALMEGGRPQLGLSSGGLMTLCTNWIVGHWSGDDAWMSFSAYPNAAGYEAINLRSSKTYPDFDIVRPTGRSITFYEGGTSQMVLGPRSGGSRLTLRTNIIMGRWGNDAGYNGITLNGSMDAQDANFFSKPTGDVWRTLFLNRPPLGDIEFREGNTNQMTLLSGGTLRVNGAVRAGSLIATNGISAAIDVLVAGGTTNRLVFACGVLVTNITSYAP